MPTPRLLIIGLDCMEPSLVFQRWRSDLPVLSRLMEQGCYGRLESSIPAITVPAWSCMMSGRDPGELGIYGFRNRLDRSYNRMGIADGRAVKVPRLWDYLGEAGWRVSVISVPGTFPPPPVNGSLISCFLTPNLEVPFTYPNHLGAEIVAEMPDFLLDVPEFRSAQKDHILENIYRLCDQRFALAERSLRQEKPDFLMLVDMGVDRIHHSFWKAMDETHPDYQPNSVYRNAIHDYYCHLDQQIEQFLKQCDPETAVLVVSDHGARALMGGFCLNEWLIQQGYLVLKQPPDEVDVASTGAQSLEDVAVDWSQTRVWGAGGYYGRIFLNVQGREPQGCLPLSEYDRFRRELATALKTIPGPTGQIWQNQVYSPQETYQRVRGVAPDLLVYFDQLAWRSIGTVGHNALYITGNDTGPDDANHAQQGLAIFYDPQSPQGGKVLENAQIYDILPTLLDRYGIAPPANLRGKVWEI